MRRWSATITPEAQLAAFTIDSLWIYPVKSLGGQRMSRVIITEGGSFLGDREWLVVDLEGRMLWQGDLPRMTLLNADVNEGLLSIVQRDGTRITLSATHDGPELAVTQYGNSFAGIDAGDAVARWLSEFLDRPCRLVRIGHQAHRWPKLNPLHLISVHSLAVLNQRMQALGEAEIEPERLRPNVVVAGTHEAFAEETIPVLSFEGSDIRLDAPCIRCELPNIRRFDALRQRQPLKLIGAMSKERSHSKPASFGIYARATGAWLAISNAPRQENIDACARPR